MWQRNGLAPKDPVAPVKQAIEQSAGDLMIVSHLPFGKLAALLVADNEETENRCLQVRLRRVCRAH
jgi:hypothetical protein